MKKMKKSNKFNSNIFIITAPSGAGKTTLVKALCKKIKNLKESISYTTRPQRSSEKNGKDYYFISEIEFKNMINNSYFIEYAKVFGYYYGTSKKWIKSQNNQEKDIILEIDWQGAKEIRKKISNSISIFILPPSISSLRERLKKRKQDSLQVIEKRLIKAQDEIKNYIDFNYVIINDNFNIAIKNLENIILSTKNNKNINLPFVCKNTLKKLLK